jgi:hypothetical protein
MYKTKFTYEFGKETIKVIAKAKDVDSYGPIGLRFQFTDEENEPIDIPYVKKVFEELEEIAAEKLYEKKYADELEFA